MDIPQDTVPDSPPQATTQTQYSLKHHSPPLPQQPHLSLAPLGQADMYTGLKDTLIIEHSLNSSLGGSNVATPE